MREENGRTKRIFRTVMLAGLLGGALISVAQSAPAPAGSAAPPKFTVDGAWPKLPLPNKWTFEGITGLVVDKGEHARAGGTRIDLLGRNHLDGDDLVVAGTTGQGAYPGSRAGALIALDRRSGAVRWIHLEPPSEERAKSGAFWGFGASPVIAHDVVYAADLDGKVYAFSD